MRRLAKRIAVLLIALPVAAGAAAQPAGAPGTGDGAADTAARIQALAAKGFKDKMAAVRALAAAGDPRAVPALEALLARKLYQTKESGQVVIAEREAGAYRRRDPLTGADLGTVAKSEIRRLRTNNRLRTEVRTALGGLTLLSDDPERRRAAAAAIFKSRPAGLLPLLDRAIARESDAAIRRGLVRAAAAVRLVRASSWQDRAAAVDELAQSSDPAVLSLLRGVLRQAADGTFEEPSETVRAAAEKALSQIESRLAMWSFLGRLFQGLSLGSVLLLAAIGLAITFGVMGVINMAHGEMVMLGAYTTFVVQAAFRAVAPAALDWSLIVAVPAAFLVAGAAGVAIERGIIRFLYGRPLETLLATWGLSLILQQLVRTVFGPTNREVSSPSWMTGAIELPGGMLLTHNRLWIIAFSLAVVAMLALVLRRTAFGLQMRSVTQNRRMAGAMGIRTGRIDALTFGLGSGIAGMAGVALSQIDNVSPNLGQAYIVDSFMVVVFGGVGNLMGTLVGATTLGIVNKFLEAWSGAVVAKILVLVAVILFIQKRPRGLFALKGRVAES